MVWKPNARMCGWGCKHVLHHLQKVCILFAANQNLSVFSCVCLRFAENVFTTHLAQMVCKSFGSHVCTSLNSATSVHDTVTRVHSRQCWYFAVASKDCYMQRLQTAVTCVDAQVNMNTALKLHGCVEWYSDADSCYKVPALLHSSFSHLVTSSRTAFVMRRSLRWCYVTVLCYMSVPALSRNL